MPVDALPQNAQTTRVYTWFSALANDDLQLMDDLLAHGVPVDVPHPLRHTTALMEATRRGSNATVHWLLARGAAPAFLCGRSLGTPLHCALRLHHTAIARALVAACERISLADNMGRTALHVLASEAADYPNGAETVELAIAIIEKDCPLDALDREGLSALHYAVIHDQPHLAELLLARGADANVRVPDTQMSPLAMVALDKNTNLANLLMQYGANPHQQARDGVTPATIFPALTRMVAGVTTKPPRRPRKSLA